jgi:hypothetical protein
VVDAVGWADTLLDIPTPIAIIAITTSGIAKSILVFFTLSNFTSKM